MEVRLRSQSEPLKLQLGGETPMGIALRGSVIEGTSDYEKLRNLPLINGVTLRGDMTLSDLYIVSEGSTAYWEQHADYIPKAGEIVVFTDGMTVDDTPVPTIRIGDGLANVSLLPVINGGDVVMDALHAHIANADIHVSPEDRARWDAKLNYTLVGEELIFNRN